MKKLLISIFFVSNIMAMNDGSSLPGHSLANFSYYQINPIEGGYFATYFNPDGKTVAQYDITDTFLENDYECREQLNIVLDPESKPCPHHAVIKISKNLGRCIYFFDKNNIMIKGPLVYAGPADVKTNPHVFNNLNLNVLASVWQMKKIKGAKNFIYKIQKKSTFKTKVIMYPK